MHNVLVLVQNALAVSRIGDRIPQHRNGNVLSVSDVAPGRLEEVDPVRVLAEETAAADAAAFPDALRANPGQGLRPQKPQLPGFGVVLLEEFVLVFLTVTCACVA